MESRANDPERGIRQLADGNPGQRPGSKRPADPSPLFEMPPL